MANTGLIRFVAFVFGVLALLFLIIATPTHNWYVGYLEASNSTNGSTEDRTGDIYGGIFEDCYMRNDNSYTCRTQEAGGYIEATKVFMILAIVGYILVTVYLLVMAFTRGICYKVVGAMLIVTGFFILVGVGIYTNKHTIHNAKEWNFSWSFALGWVSCLFTFIAGIFAFFGDVKYEKL